MIEYRPGQLNTTLHPTSVGEAECVVASRCSRDRGVWERDDAYRQVDPVKSPSPAISPDPGCTGFGFGAYDGDERFVLMIGDAVFVTSSTLSKDFLQRTDSGGSSMMDDLLVHSATQLHHGDSVIAQHRGKLYCVNEDYVRKLDISGATNDGLLEKVYDPSLYEDYFTLQESLTKVDFSGCSGVSKVSGGSGSHSISRVSSNKLIRFTDVYYPSTLVYAPYTLRATWASNQSVPLGTRWVVIPIIRDGPGAGYVDPYEALRDLGTNSFLLPTPSITYGDSADLAGYGNLSETVNQYNVTYSDGSKPVISLTNGSNSPTMGTCYFVNAGRTQYLFAYISDASAAGPYDYQRIDITFTSTADGSPQKMTIGPVYFMGPALTRQYAASTPTYDLDHQEDATLRARMAGLGPEWDDSSDFVEYAFRGCDAGETTFGDATKVIVKKSALFNADYWGETQTGVATTKVVVLSTNGTVAGGYAKVQFLRKDETGTWRRLGIDDNDGSATITDTNPETGKDGATDIGIQSKASATVTVYAPLVEDMLSACEWKGHLVFGDNAGRIYFSDQVDPSIFIWRGYTGSLGSSDDYGPRSVDVGGNNDPIIGLVGGDQLYVLTRRRAYFMSGTTGATAQGPYLIGEGVGALGIRAYCPYQGGALVASDKGLFFVKVMTSLVGRPGEVVSENITIGAIRDSWDWLVGDDGSGACVAATATDIWVFNESRFVHRSRAGLWSTGEWADGSSVSACAVDGLGRIGVAFDDSRVGYIGDFKTDGSLTDDGLGGEEFRWSVTFRTDCVNMMLTRLDMQQMPDESVPSGVEVTIDTDRNRGVNVRIPQGANNVAVPQHSGGAGTRWVSLSMSGAPSDIVSRLAVDVIRASDERSRSR